jgi:antitoxin YefM
MKVKIDASAKDLNNWIIKTNNDLKPIHLISDTGKAVLIAESEWNAILETLYVLGNPVNARVLLASIEDAKKSKGTVYDFDQLDDLFGN